MAFIRNFEIKNFKGIGELNLSIEQRHKCPVVTLVGLNESGKTTILEGVSHFLTGVDTIAESEVSSNTKNLLSLVPIGKKANFTGHISIGAIIEIEEHDKENIIKVFGQHGNEVDITSLPSQFSVRRNYVFQDGSYVKTNNNWDLTIKCKTKRAKHFRSYRRPTSRQRQEGAKDLWLQSIRAIQRALPKIAYFPTFLVDVPDRIYLV